MCINNYLSFQFSVVSDPETGKIYVVPDFWHSPRKDDTDKVIVSWPNGVTDELVFNLARTRAELERMHDGYTDYEMVLLRCKGE